MKLGLGSVQFGLNYGITNSTGQPSLSEVSSILAESRAQGITWVDTASLYGESEDVLGKLEASRLGFRICTKTVKGQDPVAFTNGLHQSLKRLGCDRVEAVLTHESNDLLGPRGKEIWKVLETFKGEGHVGLIGASVYDGAQIDALMARYPLEIVQLPVSVLDQRLLRSGHLRKLKERDVQIHARSIFLQGICLLPEGRLPSPLAGYSGEFEGFHALRKKHMLTPLEACLAFVAQTKEIDVALCGVTTRNQLQDITDAYRETNGLAPIDWSSAAAHSVELLNPSLWPKRT